MTAEPAAAPSEAVEPLEALQPMEPEAFPAVELRSISREFGSEPRVYALRDVDLTIEHGTSLAIVGASGSGKSTLLNILGCLDRPTSGTYLLDGIDVGSLDEPRRAVLRGEAIGFVFQTFNLMAHRSVLDNVMLAEVYRGGARQGRPDRAMAALERVGMQDRAGFLPTRLSGGEQQRVAIARALMADHSMLLCDEPTGNLDSANTDSVLALFDELSRAGLTRIVDTPGERLGQHAERRVRMVDGVLTEEA